MSDVNAKRFVAGATAALALAFATPAGAETGFVMDAKAAYPWVLNRGPGESRYYGTFWFGVRAGLVVSHLEVLLGVDRIWLENDVGSDRLRGGITNVPLVWAYRFGWRDSGRPLDLLLGGSLGVATRYFDGIEGHAGSVSFSANVLLPFYPARRANFYLGPEVEVIAIAESESSHIGNLNMLVLGGRVGFDTLP